MYSYTILLDLDGVVCRWPHQHVVNWRDKANLLNWLAQLQERDVSLSFIPVTNRPAGHLQYICYDWQITTGVCLAENGSVVYRPASNTTLLHPEFRRYCSELRPKILAAIHQALEPLGINWQEEPAGRLVGIEIIAKNRAYEIPRISKAVHVACEPFANTVRIETGKSVVAYPIHCDKEVGLTWLARGNVLHSADWSQSIWVADGARDIRAAQFVHQNGGAVASVGDADESYVEVIKSLGGYVAAGTYEQGLLEVLQHYITD